MTGVNFVTGFLKNKIYSIYLGLSGLGIISQFTSSISFLTYLLPFGFPMGITQMIAQNNENGKSVLSGIVYSSIVVLLIPVIASVTIILTYSDEISLFLFNETIYGSYIKILSIVTPFIVLYTIIEAVLKGIGDISLYVKLLITSSLVSFSISIPLVIFCGIEGAVYGLMINFVFFVFYSLYKINKLKILEFNFKFLNFNNKIVKDITKIGIAFLIAGALYQLTFLLLKKMVIEKYGLDGSGIFQSVLNISLFYFGFIFTSMSSYTFPKIARLYNNTDLTNELNTTIRFISLVMVPLILTLIVFRYLILLVLYTSDFVVAESLFQYQFLGDFFKALSWVLGIWLIPRSKLFYFILFDVILNANLILISMYILDFTEFGVKGVSLAYMTAYLLHFLMNLILTRKKIGFRFSLKNFKLISSSIIAITGITIVSFYNVTFGYVLFLPLISGWVLLNLSLHEFKEMKIMIKNYIVSRNLNKVSGSDSEPK